MSPLNAIASKIIKEQELIIGPLAWSEAAKVPGLKIVDQKTGSVDITGEDQKTTINRLVAQYERLFGRASHEVCREAAAALIGGLPAGEIPASLLA